MLASQPLSDLEPIKENKTEKMMAIFYQILDVYSGVIVLQVVHCQTSENLSDKKRRWARGVDPPYEGSFEDTTIIVLSSHNLSLEKKRASYELTFNALH